MTDTPLPEFLFRLCASVADAVRPHLGTARSRVISGEAHSGDATFAVDEIAEEAVIQHTENSSLPLALFTEDRGLIELAAAPEYVLVVDPIDGTRPAAAGLESTVVAASIAACSGDVRQRDVVAACVFELRGRRAFLAEKGRGARIVDQITREESPILLSTNTDLRQLYWAYEVVGRPARITAETLGGLIDGSSLRGGVFVMSSASFAISRLLTGQLDAHVDPAALILQMCEGTREEFKRAGDGRIVLLHPYDISAALLILSEAGGVATDAAGQTFDGMRLLENSPDNHQTSVTAANAALHEALLDEVSRSITRFCRSN